MSQLTPDGRGKQLETKTSSLRRKTSESEISTSQDLQLGRPTARHLHPEISSFIGKIHDELTSQNRSSSVTELKVLELERGWGTGDMGTDKTEEAKEIETQDYIVWEPNPTPLMDRHTPRITVSNTSIQLMEGVWSVIPERGVQSRMGPDTTKVDPVERND